MTLSEGVRAYCAGVAASARWVQIDLAAARAIEPGPTPVPDPVHHFLEGTREDVAAYLLTLATINFGSGWFPTLRKREGMSGYFTVAAALTDRFRAMGPWTNAQLRALGTTAVAATLDQRADHELMALYAQALRQLGTFLGDRTPLSLIAGAGGSAQRLAATVATGMAMWNDAGFFKRAQILPSDLALGGVADFADLDGLTIFADNLVPHVLRCDGVLVLDPALAARVDAGELLLDGRQEREIRACAVQACAELSRTTGVPERVLDGWLWNRGQLPRYKALPRHRARSVFY